MYKSLFYTFKNFWIVILSTGPNCGPSSLQWEVDSKKEGLNQGSQTSVMLICHYCEKLHLVLYGFVKEIYTDKI